MFRLSNVHRLATKAAVCLPKELTRGGAPLLSSVPHVRVPDVHFVPTTSPLLATATTKDGQQVKIAKVVEDLHKTLGKALQEHGSDRGVLAAPAIGYNTRVVAIHSGLERRALINPRIVIVSRAVIHDWAQDGDEVYRVARFRSIAVKYTTVEGDEETWYALPLEESEVLQRQLDALDGVSAAERVAPCVAQEPELYPEAVHSGLVSSVPCPIFKQHEKYLKRLVEPVHRANVVCMA